MKSKVLTIGGATWDVMLTAPNSKIFKTKQKQYLGYPYGNKVDISGALYCFGGGAANVSVALSKLELEIKIVTRIGNDWRGQEVKNNLQKQRVNISLVQTDSKLVTPLSFVITSGAARDHVAFVDRGASINLDLPKRVSPEINWIYLTSLVVPNWDKLLAGLLKNLKLAGQEVFWNPGGAQLKEAEKIKKLMPYVSVFDVNKEEAELVVNSKKFIAHDIPTLLRELKSLGPKAVLITDGGKGAYYFDGTRLLHQAAMKVKPINTTGAGDAFGSGFLAGLIHTADAKKAIHWGMLNSSSVITMPGAQKGLLNLAAITRGHL